MKHWGILFAVLYLVLMIVLVGPVIAACGGRLALAYEEPITWISIGVLVICQVLLFGVKVDISNRRLRPRRALFGPIVVTTFLIMVLFGLGGWSLWLAIFGEDASDDKLVWMLVATLAVSWVSWSALFWHATRDEDPERVTARMLAWLRRGSVAELLVAVPSHIVTRVREDCCAPMITGMGICVGIAVMLMVLGPGVFFLYADRISRKRRPNDRDRA